MFDDLDEDKSRRVTQLFERRKEFNTKLKKN